MKLGVITDGISRDFEHALRVTAEAGLGYAELQFLWDKEVGDLTPEQLEKAKKALKEYDLKVSCISRHNFAGIPVGDVEVGDELYNRHMTSLESCIETAKYFDTDMVRIMSFRKEMILFGTLGAEQWVLAKGAWDKLLSLLEAPVKLAEKSGVTLVLETGNNAMITSAYLGRKLIDDLGTRHLKILWDPANSLYCNEPAYPDGFEALRSGYLGHVHMKDAIVDIPKASVEMRELGTGQMGPVLEDIAKGLREDDYQGVISLESVYRPAGGDFEDGFRASVEKFKRIFG